MTSNTTNELTTYVDEQQSRFLDELFQLLRIPSISADSNHAGDCRQAAGFLKDAFEHLGLDDVKLMETEGHPALFAQKIVDPNRPTVLIYGHYDVQPPDPLELWETPPFEPRIHEGNIYARGACDDKGQMFMHLKALETLLQQDGLPLNVKFFIEGEEEVGSAHLEDLIRTHREELAADLVLISDTAMVSNEQPSITIGLRGMAYMEVEMQGPNRDLHSGVYGGGIANPINELAHMISQLHDAHGRVNIPGFYDDVEELPAEKRETLAERPFDPEALKSELGVGALRNEEGYSSLEGMTIRPTLDCNGIVGGYTGEGAKTVLPAKASAKISMRLVPNQDPQRIARLFTDYIHQIAPPSAQVNVIEHHGGEPFLTNTDSMAYQAAEKAFEEVFGITPIPTREGGSIPITKLFSEILGAQVVLMGFGLDSDAIHSPNEHFGVFNFLTGIKTIAAFHHHYAKLHAGQPA